MSSKSIKRQLYLLNLIERDSNRFCADCGTEGTRWASWNLGVFLCIRCAGIHRKLGVHISKVKSVDLDSWTTEQLSSMENKGNKKSREILEAELPDNFIRPQTNYAIEEFIRNKYEWKKYVVTDEAVGESGKGNDDIEESEESNDTSPATTNESTPNHIFTIASSNIDSQNNYNKAEKYNDDEDDDDDSLSEPEYLKNDPKTKRKTNKSIKKKSNLKDGCHKVHSDGDLMKLDHFNSPIVHKPHTNTDLISLEEDKKKDIMSLYNGKSTRNSDTGYQFNQNNFGSNHSRGYGSATYSSNYFTDSIPESSQSSYLQQIQDKLSNIRVNISSRFSTYEQPGGTNSMSSSSSAYQYHPSTGQSSIPSRNISNPTRTNTTSNPAGAGGGHTLSPDLWR